MLQSNLHKEGQEKHGKHSGHWLTYTHSHTHFLFRLFIFSPAVCLQVLQNADKWVQPTPSRTRARWPWPSRSLNVRGVKSKPVSSHLIINMLTLFEFEIQWRDDFKKLYKLSVTTDLDTSIENENEQTHRETWHTPLPPPSSPPPPPDCNTETGC